MATKYITKLAAGRRVNPIPFTGLTSQGSVTPNTTLTQFGCGGSVGTTVNYPCSLAARSVQVYSKIGPWGTAHGPNPFRASSATGNVKMSMAYGYDCTPNFGWMDPGFDFVTSGQIRLGSDGYELDQ